MQRVIFDYRARKTDIAGTPAFATQYSDVLTKQHIIDNALEVGVGDISLTAATPFLSIFTANNAQYLQLISATPFFIRTTISGVLSAMQKTSLFSYYNTTTPIDTLELYSGTTIYDPVTNSFSADGGTASQILTYMLLKF